MLPRWGAPRQGRRSLGPWPQHVHVQTSLPEQQESPHWLVATIGDARGAAIRPGRTNCQVVVVVSPPKESQACACDRPGSLQASNADPLAFSGSAVTAALLDSSAGLVCCQHTASTPGPFHGCNSSWARQMLQDGRGTDQRASHAVWWQSRGLCARHRGGSESARGRCSL